MDITTQTLKSARPLVSAGNAWDASRSATRALLAGHEPGIQRRTRFAPLELPRKKKRFRNLVVMWIGRRGDGKSLCMTNHGWIQLQRYNKYNATRPPNQQAHFGIVANYWVDFAEYANPMITDEIIDFPDWLRRKHVLLDDVGATFPSRRAMSNRNIGVINVITQIRKLHCDMDFTTQFPQVMDMQILLQVDLFARCYQYNDGRDVEVKFFDWWGQWTGKDWHKPWPPQPGWEDWVIHYNNLEHIWNRYNTDDFQPSPWNPNREEVLARQGWDMTGSGLAVPEQESVLVVPQTPEGFIDACPDAINIRTMLDTMKHEYDMSFTLAELAKMFKQRGYDFPSPNSWTAVRMDEDE